MSVFRDYLSKIYADSPDAVGNFVSNSFVFVRIRQRFWRGYRKAKGVDLAVDGLAVDQEKEVMTQPSWKLAPKDLVEEFQMFATGVEQAIARHAFSPKESAGSETSAGAASAVLVGGGRHMVDVVVWPQLQTYLKTVAEKWSEAANRWCTEEGYAKLHAHVEEQYGPEIYGKIASLIPDRDSLLAKFGLDVRTAPVKIVEDRSTDESARSGRKDEIVDLLDLAIRTPREEVAAVWESISARLAVSDGAGNWTAVAGSKKVGDTSVKGPRTIQEKTIRSIRNHTEMLSRAERYLDRTLRDFRTSVLLEFPSDSAAAKDVAKALATNDAEAVRVGKLLSEAAAAARDENAMCVGLANAVSGAKTSHD